MTEKNLDYAKRLVAKFKYQHGDLYKTSSNRSPLGVGGIAAVAAEDGFMPDGSWDDLMQAIHEAARLANEKPAQANYPTSQQFIQLAIDHYEIDHDGKNWVSRRTGQDVSSAVVKKRVTAFYHNWHEANAAKRMTPIEAVHANLDAFAIHKAEQQMLDLQNQLRYIPDSAGHLASTMSHLMEIMGVPDTIVDETTQEVLCCYRESSIAAFSHWMWQVKRCLYGHRTKWELFFVLQSDIQGVGKTWFVENLLSTPFGQMVDTRKTDSIAEDRDYRLYAEKLIIFFDELSRSSSSANRGFMHEDLVNSIKQKITAQRATGRILTTNDHDNLRKTASLIGTTNKSVAHHFADPSGMRRFWQLACTQMFNREALNAIDYVRLWQSIDETREDGYLHPGIEVYTKAARVQQSYRPHSTVSEFLDNWEDFQLITTTEYDPEKKYQTFSPRDLFSEYETYMRTHGNNYAIKNLKGFKAKLEEMTHLFQKQIKADRATMYYFGMKREME